MALARTGGFGEENEKRMMPQTPKNKTLAKQLFSLMFIFALGTHIIGLDCSSKKCFLSMLYLKPR